MRYCMFCEDEREEWEGVNFPVFDKQGKVTTTFICNDHLNGETIYLDKSEAFCEFLWYMSRLASSVAGERRVNQFPEHSMDRTFLENFDVGAATHECIWDSTQVYFDVYEVHTNN